MAQQPEIESRITRRIGLQRPRRQGRDQPARPGGAGGWRGATQQKGRDARRLGRQRKAPADRQIKLARLAPGLDHDRPQRRASGGLRASPQHALRVAGPHQQDARGIEAELGQPRRMQTARLAIQRILPDPEDRALTGRAQRNAHGKPRRGGEIGAACRIDLVQRRARDAAAQRLVQPGGAKPDQTDQRGHGAQLRLREVAAQIGQSEGV